MLHPEEELPAELYCMDALQEIRDLHIDKLGPLLEDPDALVLSDVLLMHLACRRKHALFNRPIQRRCNLA